MKIFAIRDESLNRDKILGYPLYYENSKSFYIELPEDADPWEVPLLLSSFAKRGQYSIGSYWSRIWVEQRIVPKDRQNLGQILKDNNLSEYDEYDLLKLSEGRCAQDDCFLKELKPEQVSPEILSRWEYKIDDVLPLEDRCLLLFFRNSEVRIADAGRFEETYSSCRPYLRRDDLFQKVEVQPDGNGIFWSEQASIPYNVLYESGISVPLSLQDFCTFVQKRIINTAQACRILGCSRQNIDDLVRRGKLHPVRTDEKQTLFLRNEILQRRKT